MSKHTLFLSGVAALGLSWLAVVGMGPQAPRAQGVAGPAAAAMGLPPVADLADYTLQSLTTPAALGDSFATFVTLDGQDYSLSLWPHSLRSDEFRLLVQGDDDTLTEVAPPEPRTYKGVVEDVPGATVSGSVLDDGLSLIVFFPDGRRFGIQPMGDFLPNPQPGMHAVYRAADAVVHGERRCGVDETTPTGQEHADDIDPADTTPMEDDGGIAGTTTKVVDIAFDTDAEFYVLNGSNVNSTMIDIENVMNNIENIYEMEVDMTYEVTTIIVRTNAATDPYTTTDAGTLLDQFANHWSSTKSDVRRDIAHMMTGRNLNGGTLGIAVLNSTCNTTSAYGLSESRFSGSATLRACVTAHEIGHNFAAQHCQADCSSTPGGDCRIMCPCVNSCAGDCLHFGVGETNQIVAKRNSSSCLQNEALGVALPFFDDFPSTALNSAKWAYIDGGVSTASGVVSPPSGPNALQLNAIGSSEFGDDEIRTTFINTASVPSFGVSYYTQARGVENLEALVVEYWGSNRRWNEINRIVSDGTTQDAFTLHSHTLTTSTARHAEFRLRFRTEVDQGNDNWNIDNVSVSTEGLNFSLNVDSAPLPGVAVIVTPVDVNGQASGITPFGRIYASGANVTLIAPATDGVNDFDRWTVNGVDRPAGQTSIVVAMTETVAAVANYPEPAYTLNISSSPANGAFVLVTPPDNNGLNSGTTPFSREYNPGTVALLQAPAFFGDEDFLHWVVNGVAQPDFVTSLNLTVNQNYTLNAVYGVPVTTYSLAVSSTPTSGVNITVSPLDNGGLGSGATPFARTYDDSTSVQLTAPGSAGGNAFVRWVINGANQPDGQTTVNVGITQNSTAQAVYFEPPPVYTVSVNSSPNAGFLIDVSPLDNGSLGDGTTPFQRSYTEGTNLTLIAPERTATEVFFRWNVDGIDQPVEQAQVVFPVNTDLTAVANYRLIGDTNCDGGVDFFDIDPFLLALFDPAAYAAQYCDGSSATADVDNNGGVDFFDIDGFLAILFG